MSMDGPTASTRLQRAVHGVLVAIGAVALAGACFFVLPLLQAISAVPVADLTVRSVDSVALPPPSPPPEPEQQQDEKPDEPPPPALAEQAPPLDLAQLELALNPGVGLDGAGDFVGLDGAGDFAIKLQGLGGGNGSAQGDDLFALADLDQKPRAIVQQQPRLGAQLRKKVPASVAVLFTVDASGRVEDPIVQSSTDREFEAPVLAAIRQWKFEPGKRGGQPVRFRMRQPFSFQ
jgi:periplasmic protein TonB